MISIESLSALLTYLRYHDKCKIYYEPETGQPFHGYQYPLNELKIIDDNIVYLAEKNEYILLTETGKNRRLAIHEPGFIEEMTVHRFQSARKELTFPINEFTPFDIKAESINIDNAVEFNWALYEYMILISSLETFKLLNEMEFNENQKSEVMEDLTSGDDIYPCQKILKSPHINETNFKEKLLIRIRDLLMNDYYQDINGNVIGNKATGKKNMVGPISVCIEPFNEKSSISDSCKIYGRTVDLSFIANWYPFLNKKIDKEFLVSDFGLSVVKGALKQAGIIGHDSFVTNEAKIIRIIEHEF